MAAASRLLFGGCDPAAAVELAQPALQQVVSQQAAHGDAGGGHSAGGWPWDALDAMTLLASAWSLQAAQLQPRSPAGAMASAEAGQHAAGQAQAECREALWTLALACLCQALLDAGAAAAASWQLSWLADS